MDARVTVRTISSWHKDLTRCDVTLSLHGTEIRCRLASQSFSYLQLGYIEQLPDCTWRRACRPSNGYQYRLILQGSVRCLQWQRASGCDSTAASVLLGGPLGLAVRTHVVAATDWVRVGALIRSCQLSPARSDTGHKAPYARCHAVRAAWRTAGVYQLALVFQRLVQRYR